MEERELNTGASCFLVKDSSLKQGWNSPIYDWLKKEGFFCSRGKGFWGCEWVFINILSKVYAPGRPGVAYTKVVGDHAITFEEFSIIYEIYKKYEGFSALKMTEEEQKEFEAYCKMVEDANKERREKQ